jgi:hypothetical protein
MVAHTYNLNSWKGVRKIEVTVCLGQKLMRPLPMPPPTNLVVHIYNPSYAEA